MGFFFRQGSWQASLFKVADLSQLANLAAFVKQTTARSELECMHFAGPVSLSLSQPCALVLCAPEFPQGKAWVSRQKSM